MRASTVRCRFLDRCGHSLGVEISFKDFVFSCRFNKRNFTIHIRSVVSV